MNAVAKIKEIDSLHNLEHLKASIIDSLEASKAENIVTINLVGKTNFADLMIIATGRVNKHVDAISCRLVDDLKKEDIFDVLVEGRKEGNWILVDLGDIIVNIFRPEIREFYNLEKMWNTDFSNVEKNAELC